MNVVMDVRQGIDVRPPRSAVVVPGSPETGGLPATDDGCRLLDIDGDTLTEVLVRDADGVYLLRELSSWRGRLTAYYFLRRGRSATLVLGDVLVRGCLATRWTEGRRHWVLRPGENCGEEEAA